MTVKELIKALKAMPQDATVSVVTDWGTCDEQGNMPAVEIQDVSVQRYVDVNGIEDSEDVEVIMVI